jgi:hypothetical protein
VIETEEVKMDTTMAVQNRARAEGWSQMQFTLAMQVEKTKAFDHVFNNQGFTEEDIQYAAKKHDLNNSDEFKKTMEEMMERKKPKSMQL